MKFALLGSLCLALSLALVPPVLGQAPARPKIVLLLADDMGTGDLSCYGATDVRTPQIDALATAGVRYTQFYANGAECTPSRTALLTGRHPQRMGGLECAIGTGNVGRYDDAIRLAEQSDLGLRPEDAVLAPALKALGYSTAIFGKWHLGYEPKFNPLDQGFDEFIGCLGGNVDYFSHEELSPLPVYLSGRREVSREGYMTDLITADAVDFLKRRRGTADPFFLYVAYTAPHFPFQGPDDADLARNQTAETWTAGSRDQYLKLVRSLDDSVGQILAELEANGHGDALVAFASDHGGFAPASNGRLRDFKGTTFEGGIRIPMIVRWPDRIAPGMTDPRPATLLDLTASFLSVAGAGTDLVSLLDGLPILEGVEWPNRNLFWRAKRDETTWSAIRSGDLKYVTRLEGGTWTEWLFDLAADPGEQENVAGEHREALELLRTSLRDWSAETRSRR